MLDLFFASVVSSTVHPKGNPVSTVLNPAFLAKRYLSKNGRSVNIKLRFAQNFMMDLLLVETCAGNNGILKLAHLKRIIDRGLKQDSFFFNVVWLSYHTLNNNSKTM